MHAKNPILREYLKPSWHNLKKVKKKVIVNKSHFEKWHEALNMK